MAELLFKASGNIKTICAQLEQIKTMTHEGATLEEVANDKKIQKFAEIMTAAHKQIYGTAKGGNDGKAF